ncbi:MAG: DUF3685 domain-containing protein [Prochlorotrichaceae cyanobacterium]
MDSDTDRREVESNPDYAASLTIVVVSPDPIVAAGISTILGETGAALERVAHFKQAADLILGTKSLTDPLLVILHCLYAAELDELIYGQFQRRTPPVPVLVIGQGELPPPPLPGLSLLWGNCPPERLQGAVQHLAQGQSVWWVEGSALQPLNAPPLLAPMGSVDPSWDSATPRAWVQNWLQGTAQAGTTLVQQELQQIQASLQRDPDRWLDRQILQGQQRELKLVQWLLQQGLKLGSSPPDPSPSSPPPEGDVSPSGSPPSLGATSPEPLSPLSTAPPPVQEPAIVFTAASPSTLEGDLLPGNLERLLFDRVTAKLATPLLNLTPLPLEIDGLNLPKRRELLILVLQTLEDRLTELRHSDLTLEQLRAEQQAILADLWQETVTRFFGQYTIVHLGERSVSLVPRLLAYRDQVTSFILSQIPLWLSLLEALLFQEAVPIDGSPYRCDSPEALNRLEQILENVVVQVANATLQPLFNECSRVEVIKQAYFHPRLLSTRQIERFRNDLSWKYRVLHNFEDPRNIYESRFALLILQPGGIHRIAIYAPRQDELSALNPWQQSVTLGLEFRDALAPRLQSLTRWLGQGVVYVLTHVLGRAIGLVGRGIVQGLGSVWSDRAK